MPSKEAERILQFARVWAPFGGAPDEEVFVRFGISRTLFPERLWQVIVESGCDAVAADQFRKAYPCRQSPWMITDPRVQRHHRIRPHDSD
ncbi:hypothetical protein C8E05_2510 [Rhodococcus wratislaviensis]|nr:hypothetical protein C8E05_2510 [Rhodococcus wratislaviensis]